MPDALLMLIVVLLVLALLLVAGAAAGMAHVLLRPPRMTDGKAAYVLQRLSPADLGLAFETVDFLVRDAGTGRRVRIAGWWIAHPNAGGRCVILLHGYGDAKVGAIAWAPMFHALGWNVLAIDLRAHGESDGPHCTAGWHERHDLDQVIDQIRAQRPRQTRQLVLFGVSLGAAVAVATAVMRDDLSAVILDCPFADYRQAAMNHAERAGMPGRLVQRIALRMAEWISGADFAAIRPVDLIPRVPCPLMVIQCCGDPVVGVSGAAAIEAAVQCRPVTAGPSCHWFVDQAPHVQALRGDPALYQQRIGRFLSQALEHQQQPEIDAARAG